MKTTIATFMKIAVTTVVIAALLFGVGYKMTVDESHFYDDNMDKNVNSALTQ